MLNPLKTQSDPEIVRLVRLEHQPNPWVPILVTGPGKTIPARLEQNWKDELPMLVTEAGMTMLLRLVQL